MLLCELNNYSFKRPKNKRVIKKNKRRTKEEQKRNNKEEQKNNKNSIGLHMYWRHEEKNFKAVM